MLQIPLKKQRIAKNGVVGMASMGMMRPDLAIKSIVPVVTTGVLGIYVLIIAVIISTGINPKASVTIYSRAMPISLPVSLVVSPVSPTVWLSESSAMPVSERMHNNQSCLGGMILILIFAETLALYGPIVGIILPVLVSLEPSEL